MNLTSYIGLPYKSKGRDRSGVDCWGLCRLFHKEQFNNDLPAYDAYTDAGDSRSVAQVVKDNVKNWTKVETPEYGDILMFRIMGLPAHTAIYLGDGDFLHAFKDTNACIERLKSITWEPRLVGVYRWEQK